MNQDIICAGALTEETLSQAMATFTRTIRPERERLAAYYQGVQDIPKGEAVRGRPNNLLHVPFPRYISEVHTGYFLGIPPTFTFAKAEEGAVFTQLASRVGLNRQLFDVGRDMSVCGMGFLLVWLEQAGLRVCRCDPLNCFSLRDETAEAALRGTVRLYQDANQVVHGILYQTETLRHFRWDGNQVQWEETEENLLHRLPLLPFANNADHTGDFQPVTGLVDAYNLLLSGAMDDMQSVANAFLALYGMQSTTQGDIDEANRTRVLSLAEGGKAEFVVKNLNHEALAQLETNLRRSILQLSMTPDLSDEQFAGSASGVALQYKLWGVEQVRAAKERSFSTGLSALLDTLAGGLTLLGTPVSFAAETIFYKNLPQNQTELAETLLALAPVLSKRTILENLPWVSDVNEELRRKEEEGCSD